MPRRRPDPVPPAEPPKSWVLPWWAERQLDPASPAYAPKPSECRYWNRAQNVEARLLANTRGRSWTFIGRPETLDRATVDPRGLFTLLWGTWSLDWWVRAGDTWVFPSRAPAVRQRLVGGMPVVETVLPVEGGDVVHRVAAAGNASSAADGTTPSGYSRRVAPGASVDDSTAPEVFVVEITNRTPAPVDVALAARPYHLGAFELADGDIWEWSNLWSIDRIRVEGRVLSLSDGFGPLCVMFDRDPAAAVVASHGTDCATALESPDRLKSPVSVECPQRLANAAVVFLLEAGATLRAAVPGRGLAFRSNAATSQRAASQVLRSTSSLDRIANVWRQRLDAGFRLDLPDRPLGDAVLAARASQLLGTAPCDDGPGVVGPMLWPSTYTDAQFDGDDLVQLLGLIESGEPRSVQDLLIRQAEVQHSSGDVSSMGHTVTGTSLVLAEHLLSLHPDPAFGDAISKFVTSAVRWLLSLDAVERWAEPWTVREGLRAGFRLLQRAGADRAAADLRHSAMSLRRPVRRSVRTLQERLLIVNGQWDLPSGGQ